VVGKDHCTRVMSISHLLQDHFRTLACVPGLPEEAANIFPVLHPTGLRLAHTELMLRVHSEALWCVPKRYSGIIT